MIDMTPEQQRLAEQWVEATAAAAGEAMKQLVEHLIRGGESPIAAVRLAGAAMLLDRFGDTILTDLGVSDRTSRDVRARLVASARAAGEVVEPAEATARPGGRRAARAAEDSRAS